MQLLRSFVFAWRAGNLQFFRADAGCSDIGKMLFAVFFSTVCDIPAVGTAMFAIAFFDDQHGEFCAIGASACLF